MVKDQDEKALFDTIALLEHERKPEYASALVKMMVQRTLALLRKSTDFLEGITFISPPIHIFQSFHDLDKEIRRSIGGNDQRTNELLVEYIDLLPKVTMSDNKEQIRKFILANLLASSERPAEVLVEEKIDVYTSTEAAEILGVSDQTIRRWCDKGKYPKAFQTEGGHWRIPQKYFMIDLEQARKRKGFEQKLSEFNASTGEVDEGEWL